MISLLVCRCANSEPLIRKALREAHHPKWSTLPVIKGKAPCLQHVSTLPTNTNTGALTLHLQRASSWSVILEDHPPYRWVDVGHATVKDRLDAEIILGDNKNKED